MTTEDDDNVRSKPGVRPIKYLLKIHNRLVRVFEAGEEEDIGEIVEYKGNEFMDQTAKLVRTVIAEEISPGLRTIHEDLSELNTGFNKLSEQTNQLVFQSSETNRSMDQMLHIMERMAAALGGESEERPNVSERLARIEQKLDK